LMYFIYLYENNTINYVEVILRMGGGDEGEWWWGEPNQGTL
jgi:hypothetical protein